MTCQPFVSDSHYRPILQACVLLVKRQTACLKDWCNNMMHAQSLECSLMSFSSGVVEFVRCDILCFQGVLGLEVALKCHRLCGRIVLFCLRFTETLSRARRRHLLTETKPYRTVFWLWIRHKCYLFFPSSHGLFSQFSKPSHVRLCRMIERSRVSLIGWDRAGRCCDCGTVGTPQDWYMEWYSALNGGCLLLMGTLVAWALTGVLLLCPYKDHQAFSSSFSESSNAHILSLLLIHASADY